MSPTGSCKVRIKSQQHSVVLHHCRSRAHFYDTTIKRALFSLMTSHQMKRGRCSLHVPDLCCGHESIAEKGDFMAPRDSWCSFLLFPHPPFHRLRSLESERLVIENLTTWNCASRWWLFIDSRWFQDPPESATISNTKCKIGDSSCLIC